MVMKSGGKAVGEDGVVIEMVMKSGEDGVVIEMVKAEAAAGEMVVDKLTELPNRIYANGYRPDAIKESICIAIPKKPRNCRM
ncbi:hypothetical protein Pmani_026985 [Petrolisthes manimaculis]|uniref:Uncharacterized protein n=1 Tax=Petrolisthes manimaculis TaxID=1843537 RepID=A0AAE1P2I5_9EUCA|nr:hypothetical protein Pmani_026985 [Petrolisthes manimaculis]